MTTRPKFSDRPGIERFMCRRSIVDVDLFEQLGWFVLFDSCQPMRGEPDLSGRKTSRLL